MVFATWLLLTPKSSSAADGIEEVAKIQMVVGQRQFSSSTHWHCEG
jgi:hypothetical protein